MATDDPSDSGNDPGDGADTPQEADDPDQNRTARAVEEFDDRIVDLLAWLLDTETKARIYVHLQQRPHSTSDEITEGTGLYPSTVREALAELTDDGTVERRKRETDGAGNNPYEYTAIPPSDLVGNVAGQIQAELNTVFNLDEYLRAGNAGEDGGPVTITVEKTGGQPVGDDLTETATDSPDEAVSDPDRTTEDEPTD